MQGLRQEGKRVLLHCAAGRSRTPTAAARYSVLLGIDPATAMTDICQALAPNHPWVNHELERFVFDLAGEPQPVFAKRVWNTRTARSPWSVKE